MRYGFPGEERFALDCFEILNEPTGTNSIFDISTELPAAVESRAFIGLHRHEVPLALAAIMETVVPADGPLPPSLAAPGGVAANDNQQEDLDDHQQDSLQA